MVIAWATAQTAPKMEQIAPKVEQTVTRVEDIVLWGFSLGTFPTLYCAAKYPVLATILQSPLASICNIFEK